MLRIIKRNGGQVHIHMFENKEERKGVGDLGRCFLQNNTCE
jgi:hypothetical protein